MLLVLSDCCRGRVSRTSTHSLNSGSLSPMDACVVSRKKQNAVRNNITRTCVLLSCRNIIGCLERLMAILMLVVEVQHLGYVLCTCMNVLLFPQRSVTLN